MGSEAQRFQGVDGQAFQFYLYKRLFSPHNITQDSELSSLSLQVSKIEAMISSMMPTHRAKDQNGWCCRFGATILSLLFSDDDIIKCTISREEMALVAALVQLF